MNDPMLPLPGLSSASGKPVVVKFDGGLLSSDGGVLALREVEQPVSGRRSARRLYDRSSRGRSDHAQLGGRHPFSTADDQRRLRGRQRRQCAAPRSDVQDGARSFAHRSGVVLGRSTISRLENLPDVRAVLRMGRAMVDLYSKSFATVPKRITRADSHYCGPEVLDWCRANGLDYILGIAPTATLRRHVEGLEASTKAKSRPRREMASFVVSWSSSTARKAGAGSSGSSPASKRARRTGHPQPTPSAEDRFLAVPARSLC